MRPKMPLNHKNNTKLHRYDFFTSKSYVILTKEDKTKINLLDFVTASFLSINIHLIIKNPLQTSLRSNPYQTIHTK